MIIICGKTIAEVERDLEMVKMAIASGMPYGIGGATMAEVAQAMRGLKQAVGVDNPITNPNYVGVPPIEDEDEICPNCGEPYDGCYCENCDTDSCEDECDCCCGCCSGECEDEEEVVPPIVVSLVKMLRALGADKDTIGKLLS